MPLPQEILALVISHLKTKDLLQCQLTSKQWYNASLKPLYTYILGTKREKLIAYDHTITHSSHLGKYLNAIEFGALFYAKEYPCEFGKTDLLDRIIHYCPNISKIHAYANNIQFWSRLLYAATQGQLSHLMALPRPFSPNLKYYVDMTLRFTNTLTSLWIVDSEFRFRPNLTDLVAEGTLSNQLDKFKSLETLNIECFTNKHLIHYDELIDRCHNLKALKFKLESMDIIQQLNESVQTILPRPDIQLLSCRWEQINVNDQLEYLMRKFPNLQRLKVKRVRKGHECSGPILLEFIRYAISLSDFELHTEVGHEDVPNIVIDFTKIKNGCKNITLAFYYNSSNIYRIKLHVKEGLSVIFPPYLNGKEPPHIKLLSKVGKSIRSLIINNVSIIPRRNDKTRHTITWLFDLLRLCPLMEEITLCNPVRSSPIHQSVQYPSLKKLTMDIYEDMRSINFLNCLSLTLPNLCQLSLELINEHTDPIVIDMPYTSLDLLIWNDKLYNTGHEVYIKLNTEKGLEYYEGVRSTLLPISQSLYLLSPKSARFDIYCKQLKELRIRKDYPEFDSDLVF